MIYLFINPASTDTEEEFLHEKSASYFIKYTFINPTSI